MMRRQFVTVSQLTHPRVNVLHSHDAPASGERHLRVTVLHSHDAPAVCDSQPARTSERECASQ